MEPVKYSNYRHQDAMETQVDPFVVIPRDVSLMILSYLGQNFPECALVNRQWRKLVDNPFLHPKIAFGAAKWRQYIGDPGVGGLKQTPEPVLPRRVHRDLANGNYLLTLIPSTIDNKPLTIKSIEGLVSNPKEGNKTKYKYEIWSKILEQYGDLSTDKPHWVLMTADVLDNSRNKDPDFQQKLIVATKQGMPELLSAIASIFMRYVSTGEMLFSENPWTYTRVKEKVVVNKDEQYHIVVGGFAAAGLTVRSDVFGIVRIGVAGARKSIGH